MDTPFRFVGALQRYRKLSRARGWGDFFLINEGRSGRAKPPLHPGDCPFCSMSSGRKHDQPVTRVRVGAEEYIVTDNKYPIVENQRIITPAGVDEGTHSVHRLDLSANDVQLALRLAREGFHGLLQDADAQPWACYVNALPGTGRSVAHLHINCVPANYVPLLPNAGAPWAICGIASTAATISRVAGIGFYALSIEGADDEKVAQTVADLHAHMNEWQQPYNLLVIPDASAGSVRVLMVPRDGEYCEAADQRVAGLEFMTGVLIPGPARSSTIDTILRDRAFWQATLKRDRQLQLERRLRGIYGLPPAGHVVKARRQGKRFEPVVENNDVLTKQPARRRLTPKAKNVVFGKIDGRHWILPRRNKEEPDSHARRVDANVLVRITRASICQSDRRVLANEKNATLADLALGHEGGGYIVDPGPWASELMSGDKVVILPHLSCGECEACHRYIPNLCKKMEHLGFHLNGNLADLMAFPYQCVLPVGPDFPDDALPLIEPLACVLRALFRIRVAIRKLADENGKPPQSFTIFGGGPMGFLTALAVQRNWPSIRIQIVEPNDIRRAVLARWATEFEILASPPRKRASAITFVASSNFNAVDSALDTTDFGGTVLLFAGINKAEQKQVAAHFQGTNLEYIHRWEQDAVINFDFGQRIRLIGSSGYTLDDVKRSLIELRRYYRDHYRRVQNVEVQKLDGAAVVYSESGKRDDLNRPAVESLLANVGVADPFVSSSLKVLIRL